MAGCCEAPDSLLATICVALYSVVSHFWANAGWDLWDMPPSQPEPAGWMPVWSGGAIQTRGSGFAPHFPRPLFGPNSAGPSGGTELEPETNISPCVRSSGSRFDEPEFITVIAVGYLNWRQAGPSLGVAPQACKRPLSRPLAGPRFATCFLGLVHLHSYP